MNTPSAEWYATRRKAKLEAQQTRPPLDSRMANGTVWDDDIDQRSSVVTLWVARAREPPKQEFITLATDPTVELCETPEEALPYSTPDRQPSTTTVLRSSPRPTQHQVILSTLVYLSTAANMRAAGHPVHREFKEATLQSIYGPLVTKGLIHTTARKKVTPIQEDISAFPKVMFTPRFASTVSSTREVLLLALFVCLQVDSSARISELAMPSLVAAIPRPTKNSTKRQSFEGVVSRSLRFQTKAQVVASP